MIIDTTISMVALLSEHIIDSEKSDLFDVLAHVAYALEPLTREEREDRAMAAISENFNPRLRVFLDFVLSHYVAVGVAELDQAKLTPLLKLQPRLDCGCRGRPGQARRDWEGV